MGTRISPAAAHASTPLDNARAAPSNQPVRDASGMTRPRTVIDLARVRANAEAVVARTGGTPLLAVVKSDAYGLGMREVARALADVVDGFCVLTLAEAVANDLWALTAKPTI